MTVKKHGRIKRNVYFSHENKLKQSLVLVVSDVISFIITVVACEGFQLKNVSLTLPGFVGRLKQNAPTNIFLISLKKNRPLLFSVVGPASLKE